MKPKIRMIALLLAAIIALTFAPFSLAAENGAMVSVQKGETKPFQLYPRTSNRSSAAGAPALYSDFASVSSGDEHIAKIVEQHGTLQIVGLSLGVTTYEATTKDGETFTGIISVIDRAPAERADDAGELDGSNGNWLYGGGGGYQYCLEYFIYGDADKYSGEPLYHMDNPDYYINNADYYTDGHGDVYYIGGDNIDDCGRIRIRYSIGRAHDVTLSASGGIRLDDDGYFYKDGEASSLPGSVSKVWAGTITMASPTMGTTTVDVYLE